MAPCCANQKPNLKPPMRIVFNCSANRIPHPKEATNQMDKRMNRYRLFLRQYASNFLLIKLGFGVNRMANLNDMLFVVKIKVRNLIRADLKCKSPGVAGAYVL